MTMVEFKLAMWVLGAIVVFFAVFITICCVCAFSPDGICDKVTKGLGLNKIRQSWVSWRLMSHLHCSPQNYELREMSTDNTHQFSRGRNISSQTVLCESGEYVTSDLRYNSECSQTSSGTEKVITNICHLQTIPENTDSSNQEDSFGACLLTEDSSEGLSETQNLPNSVVEVDLDEPANPRGAVPLQVEAPPPPASPVNTERSLSLMRHPHCPEASTSTGD